MVEEGSFPLGPERQVAGCAPHEHLGGGQHVEGARGCPALCVLCQCPVAVEVRGHQKNFRLYSFHF